MSENRVDPTVAGLFLVAFIALVFGLFGIETYSSSTSWGVPAPLLAAIIGIAFVVLTVSAIRCGNAFAASLFAFVAIALIAVQVCLGVWIMFVLIAVFFIVFALIAFLIGAPKLLAIMIACVALLYLFVGLYFNTGTDGYAIAFAIFGFLGGLVALYLGFALSTEKLPVF